MFEKVEGHKIDYYKLEQLINTHLGSDDFSIPADQECGNDVTLEFHVMPRPLDSMDEWDLRHINEAREGRGSHNLSDVLDYLCSEGHVPEGKLYVRVSW